MVITFCSSMDARKGEVLGCQRQEPTGTHISSESAATRTRRVTHLRIPFSFRSPLTAPTLVHTSSDETSIEASRILRHISVVDSLLVLLQNRKGMLASRRRVSACAAPGVGVVPISSVPEISMRRAQSGGRDTMLEALLIVLSEAAIDLRVRYKAPGGKTI